MPYTGIVEEYFNANEMSVLLQKKFNRYKELVNAYSAKTEHSLRMSGALFR
jgi:hypothetical protein